MMPIIAPSFAAPFEMRHRRQARHQLPSRRQNDIAIIADVVSSHLGF